MYTAAIKKLGVPGHHPPSKGSFVQLSFDTYTLLPSGCGYPPHTPDPPDQNPFAAPYPSVSCSWTLFDLPHCLPIGVFELPFHDLIPFTLDVVFQPGHFSILDCKYDEDIHNRETCGILTWKLSGRTSVTNLSTIISFSTAFALTLMAGRMSSQKIPHALPISLNAEEAKFLPMVNQAHLAANALTRLEYESRMDKNGNWLQNGETRRGVQRPSAVTRRRNARLEKMWANSKGRRGLRETSLDKVFNDPDNVHRCNFEQYPDTVHIRMECAPAFSSVYGAREVRLVATLPEDEIEALDTDGLKSIPFVLSMNDYNKGTIAYPLKQLEEEAEKGGQKKGRKKKKKKKGRSNGNGEMEHVDQNHLILQHPSTDLGERISFRLHQSQISEELATFLKETLMHERTSFPNDQNAAILEIDMDLQMMPDVRFDGNNVLLSGLTVSYLKKAEIG